MVTEGFTATLVAATLAISRSSLYYRKKPRGSRVDRHDHIGDGFLGLEPFRRIVNDPRFRDLPMLLETPKTARRSSALVQKDPLDERNLSTLRRLMAR